MMRRHYVWKLGAPHNHIRYYIFAATGRRKGSLASRSTIHDILWKRMICPIGAGINGTTMQDRIMAQLTCAILLRKARLDL